MYTLPILIDLANEVNTRRQQMNAFFLTLHSIFLPGLYVMTPNLPSLFFALPLCFIGIITSFIWLTLIKKYRMLNTVKYAQIHYFEKALGIDFFGIYTSEWEYFHEKRDLGGSKIKCALPPLKNATKFSIAKIEQKLPVIFIGLYLILILLLAVTTG